MEKETNTPIISIIGLGALGILFGNHLSKQMPKENLRIIADSKRIAKYKKEKIYCNDELCDFNYMTPDEVCEPADLVIIAVKYQALQDAIDAIHNQVGDHTIILSALNGITSEEIIGNTYGMDKLLYCVAQSMDAVKVDNKLTYHNMGMLVFGEKEKGIISSKVQMVESIFKRYHFPYEVDTNMVKRLWGKFMLNVGVNQTLAVYEGTYGDIQKDGPIRSEMIASMQEVIELSKKEGVHLSEEDLDYWLRVLSTLNPKGKPSMCQDFEAKRYSEVELFAGTVVKLAKIHGLQTPMNQKLYDTIHRIESSYEKETN